MTIQSEKPYSFEVGVYRPPSEGGSDSLLVRFTRNCPWNRCAFCAMYKHERFSLRSVAEIRQDIDAIAAICRELTDGAGDSGISREAVIEFIRRHPELADSHETAMVVSWLASGGKTAFIQDANSLLMKTPDLVAALEHLRSTFPSLERVTSYARSHTLARKSAEALTAIRQAGLDRVHVGLESGDDDLLKLIHKGVTAADHIRGGQKALAAGFQLSEYWMPGLGGREHWHAHAENTARVINAINPHYIRSRPYFPLPGTPLSEMFDKGDLTQPSPREQLQELQVMMAALTATSRVCFDHAGNYWRNRDGGLLFHHGYEGYKFPEEKPRVLDLIAEGMSVDNVRPLMRGL
jgi:radical SAM superfamily enzyme YgiQ (UPF0313 family)